MHIPKAKRVRITGEMDPTADGVRCAWCNSPRFPGEFMFRVEKDAGDEYYCSTTCKTFNYGTAKGGRWSASPGRSPP